MPRNIVWVTFSLLLVTKYFRYWRLDHCTVCWTDIQAAM